jgi:selenocysteine lyase/cysteine desulfurase
VDFAVFAGHKSLLGPTGVSGFVMKPGINLPPVLFGGTGFESANQDMPLSIPERFEAGTLNAVGVAGLNASLCWIEEQSVEALLSKEQRNRQRLLELLQSYDYLSVVGNRAGCEFVGIVSCLMDEISSDSAGELFSRRNISVRTGLHCAPMAHRFLGTFPAGTIRFSVNSLTTDIDFGELEAVLDDLEEELG